MPLQNVFQKLICGLNIDVNKTAIEYIGKSNENVMIIAFEMLSYQYST